ncbi:pyrroline-5-carboxylate reductase [Candidatus Stoquefichus sp. SB1]|uniref:pyrroline-5-carboxylate reductase n=1 Tax=Candidatus Stoquefichus sp. SB1 TaxID=1658109 RepID=UPI00067EBDC1|nr:pyrroline-5-carboxylate reductase [Candidatus Stoquefichus sp. SB1]
MKKIGFIGMGNMAGAIACGIAKSGFLKGEEMIAYDVMPSQLDKVKEYHFAIAKNEQEVVEQSEIVFIGVKPQVVEAVLLPLKDLLKDKALISIVLGYDFAKYNDLLDASTRHIFVMPNTPALVLKGMSLIEATHSLTPEEFEFTKEMFASIGEIEVVPSHLMGAAGTVSGCGPAFIYMVIEALADGAVKEGVPRQMAYKLASQMVLGSGAMQLETTLHPGVLKDQVCSPGGSTIRGVEALEKGNVRAAFVDAITSAIHYK